MLLMGSFFFPLTLSTLGKIFSRRHIEIFFFIISRNHILVFHAIETVCMKCQILISGKNKKNIISLLSAEVAHRVVKVKASRFEKRSTQNLWKYFLLEWSPFVNLSVCHMQLRWMLTPQGRPLWPEHIFLHSRHRLLHSSTNLLL